MACRGVFFALNDDDAQRLLAAAGDDRGHRTTVDEIEDKWDEEWLAETDKAWDALHRCLSDGRLNFEALTHRAMCVLGGQQLYGGDNYIVSLLTPEQVKQVAAAIRDIDEAWIRNRCFSIPADDDELPISQADCLYTVSYFEGVQALDQKAAMSGRAMIFTVDQ